MKYWREALGISIGLVVFIVSTNHLIFLLSKYR